MHGQILKIFRRPKNREDGSDFDDFRAKKSQRCKLLDEKKWHDRNEQKVPEIFEKLSNKNSKILKIDIADVIKY